MLEYCCIIWNPYQLDLIRSIESIQRDFTNRMEGMHEKDYWERLTFLNIFSLERRRERYIILYVFKIIYELVPNPGISWYWSPRHGRQLYAPTIRYNSRFGQTYKYNSFFCLSARLFNCLPKDIRNLSCCMETVKSNLDVLLHKVPDEPRLVKAI